MQTARGEFATRPPLWHVDDVVAGGGYLSRMRAQALTAKLDVEASAVFGHGYSPRSASVLGRVFFEAIDAELAASPPLPACLTQCLVIAGTSGVEHFSSHPGEDSDIRATGADVYREFDSIEHTVTVLVSHQATIPRLGSRWRFYS
jgi:hypothetical protein